MRIATCLRTPKNPIPGTDIAGTVEAVGAGVERLAVGDEVFGWCAGAFAEYAVTSQDQLVRKPASLTRSSQQHGTRRMAPDRRCRPRLLSSIVLA